MNAETVKQMGEAEQAVLRSLVLVQLGQAIANYRSLVRLREAVEERGGFNVEMPVAFHLMPGQLYNVKMMAKFLGASEGSCQLEGWSDDLMTPVK